MSGIDLVDQHRLKTKQKKQKKRPSQKGPSDLEVNPPIQCYESLPVLDINVASKQQQRERLDQSGVSQVDPGVLHLWMKCEQSN